MTTLVSEFKVAWRKSSHCDGGACAEVALVAVPGEVLVRDSKLGDASPILTFTPAEWAVFLGQVRAGL